MADIDLNEFFANSDELFKAKPRAKRVYDEIFSFETGNKYLVRLLPYLKEGKEGFQKTSFAFQQYAWRSCRDGHWVYIESPRTYNKQCAISEWYFKAKDSNDPAIKDKVKKLSDNFRKYVYYNIYIVSDPAHPENNGKVKILRAGKQLDDIIKRALSTDAAAVEEFKDELGVDNMRRAVFDLSPDGINLCIDCQDQGGFPNYKSSRFVGRKRDLELTSKQIDEIHKSVFDLTTVNRKFEPDEAAKIFADTFLGIDGDAVVKAATKKDDPAPKHSSHEESESIDTTDLDAIERELAEEGWESSL